MEQRDLDLIAKHSGNDQHLRLLWEDHVMFEKMLERLESKPFRTPGEDLEVKELKKKKLAGKTKLENILEKYRKSEA
jgi:uncharacterized protein